MLRDRPRNRILRPGRQTRLPALPGNQRHDRSPQTNGICGFHKTILQEFYQITFRKKLYETVEALQADLDQWIDFYNTERTHQGKMCCGRTPIETMIEGKKIWKEKFVN